MRKLFFGVAIAAVGLLPWSLSHGQTTLSYQQGVDGYEGCFDLIIGRNNLTSGDPDLEYGDSNVLGSSVADYFLDGVGGDLYEAADEKQLLIRFDGILSDIPAGATIVSASLEITTSLVGNAQSGGTYNVSQLLVPFDETTTYNNTDDGLRFYYENETARPLPNGYVGIDQGEVVSADITEIVQAWVDGADNFGVTVTAGTTNGWSICTTGNTDSALHPKLVITYETGVTAPQYESGSVSQDPNDPNTVNFWVKTLTDEWFDGDLTNPEGEFLDGGTPDDQGLFRFNNLFESEGGFVPDGATIKKATLVITTANFALSLNAPTNGEWGVRQVTTDWDGTGSFADLTFGAFVDSEYGITSDSQAKFDVTSIVQAWQNGDANYGFNIASMGTTDGWAVLFSSAPQDTPKLIVEWTNVLIGDANGDGVFNNADIEPFVLALLNRSAYEAMYPNVDPDVVLDFSGNGLLDNADIQGFVDALLGG